MMPDAVAEAAPRAGRTAPRDADRCAEIRTALAVLCEPSDVIELRVPKAGRERTISGYYSDHDKLARDAAELDKRGDLPGIYITLNPVGASLQARSANRMRAHAEHTTADPDIIGRRWLPIDLDPVRPAGISSTDAEHAAALALAHEARDWLVELSFSRESIILADSGNGAHVLVRVELPNDADALALVKRCLAALELRYSAGDVHVDTTTSNAARIWKLYGTTARKGDTIPDRPHRRARLLRVPEVIEVAPCEALERLAALAPVAPERAPAGNRHDGGGALDVDAWLARAGLTARRNPWQGGTKWVLSECPFAADDHGADAAAYVVQHASGAVSAGCQHARCTWKWHELRDRYEPGVTRPTATRPVHPVDDDGIKAETDWPGRQPLPEVLPAVPTLPSELLPGALADWVHDVTERLQVAPETVAAPALVCAGSVIGRTIGIHPRRADDWLVIPNVWGMLVGRPGMLKSPAVREATRFLRRLAADASERFERGRDAGVIDCEAIELRIAALRKREAKNNDLDAFKDELTRLMEERARCTLTERRYLTQDATVEKLAALLRDNPRGLLVLRDELSGWLRTLDKPGREGEREFYLEAWNGDGAYTVDRIGRGTLHIPALSLSVFGTIQPGKLRSYIAAAATEGRGDDGLLQRFQLAVWPDLPAEWRNVDRWPETAARERAAAVFRKLDELTAEAVGGSSAHSEIPAVRFAPDAQELFDAWRTDLEARLRGAELVAFPAYEAHVAKYRSLMPALALILHLVALVDGGGAAGPVPLSVAKLAAAWVDFLDAHARRLYAVELDSERAAARALAEHIEHGDVRDGATVRDVYRRGWTALQTRELVDAALGELQRLAWVRTEARETGGREARVIRLHPELRSADR